jgi:hypothetical protein
LIGFADFLNLARYLLLPPAMLRFDFIKSMFGMGALAALNPYTLLPEKQAVTLLETGIAGFQYYEGPVLLKVMNKHDELRLLREPENKYDASAIAIYYRNQKIGFIPRIHNAVLSKLMDKNILNLNARITFIDRDASPYDAVEILVTAIP